MSTILNTQSFKSVPNMNFSSTTNNNLFYGETVGASISTGQDNTGFGTLSLSNITTGQYNTVMGSNSLLSITNATGNAAFGAYVMSATTGSGNSGYGTVSLFSLLNGEFNTAVGNYCGYSISTGGQNSLLGAHAGGQITTGQTNSFVGYSSGSTDSTCSNSSILGANAQVGNFSNSTALGANTTCTAAHQIMLGTSSECVVFPGTTANGSAQFAGPLQMNQSRSIVAGSTSGQIIVTMPEQGTAYKKVVIYCDALDGNASYTFPVAFDYIPDAIISSSLTLLSISSLTTSAITLDATSSQTGFVILEGF